MIRKIGHKIILAVGSAVALGLVSIALFFVHEQEDGILAQNERAMRKVTESVINGLQTVMLAGYADIAQAYAASLKGVGDVADFRILRTNGNEAFQDNRTINDVNERRDVMDFRPRDTEAVIPVLDKDFPKLRDAINTGVIQSYEEETEAGRALTFLAPILNKERCQKCHGKDHSVRGVVKLTTSLAPVAREIEHTWRQSMGVLGIALFVALLTTWVMVRRTVVGPIQIVTDAMLDVSRGNLSHKVPVVAHDELGVMAANFNVMAGELLTVYEGLHREQDKLTTIILSAQEGIVVTNGDGNIVLVNPAAESLLAKSLDDIVAGGLAGLFGSEAVMDDWLKTTADRKEAHILEFGQHQLSVSVSTIRNPEGAVIGSACLFRDITEEKRLENELRQLSNTDGLTRLFNRRYLDASLAAEVARANRYGLPLSILMFDVDHFKKFNDQHGHETGDRVLQMVADVTRHSVRSIDLPCRYGGEEFVVILPNTSSEPAQVIAERLRAAIQNTPVEGLGVTVTIGVASIPQVPASSGDELVRMCDQALYEGKRGGRNRVVVATAGKPA